jgi:murein DD-endopeptidase MepM/ murein hydrolase activator NlpD
MLTGDYYYNGKFVMVNHGNNLISMFLHLNDIKVKKDDVIKKGQIIGTVGTTGLSTGPHLHWSVLLNNSYIDPLKLINN